ncbi:hypothetical protein HGM15179_012079 [Zosterops borbonicus]|uniref:Uncharacterized protein n=1 Tax=Zosterops borbonicus TaxID=364589 RepID=A0A8K1GB59_9PASS|nr:hypothetical protein HGM15179_012079 [Zosterops borbonicus]
MTSLLLLATPFLNQTRMPWAFLTTRSHCWLMFSCCGQCPLVLLCPGTFQSHHPQPIALQEFFVAKMQDFMLLDSAHLSSLSRSPVPSYPPTDRCSQPGVICKFTDDRLNLLVQIINEDIKQN